MSRRVMGVAWLVVMGFGLGCGPTIVLDERGDTSGSSTGVATPPVTTAGFTAVPPPPPPPPSTGDPTVPLPTGDDSTTEDTLFIEFPDGGHIPVECDLWAQDCPRGDKCMPWANDGGSAWNATRCSPIAQSPGDPGDPCTVEGSAVSGIDDCALGAMCFYVDESLEGTCVGFCTGDEASPQCEQPGTSCLASSFLALCFPRLQPAGPGLPAEQSCLEWGSQFMCLPGGTGEPGDTCDNIAMCAPGSSCVQSEFVPDCMGLGCCTSYCSLDDPMPACLPGQVCTPYFEGVPPPGFELVGACTLP